MTAESLRLEGNELYKKGEYAEAIGLYKRSAELAPEDAAPLGNLSAALLKSGNYPAAILACDRAIALQTDADKVQALLHRKAKCQIFVREYLDAKESSALLHNEQERDDLLRCCSSGLAGPKSDLSMRNLQARLIDFIPRYKPAINPVEEYFSLGHDEPTPLVDGQLFEANRPAIDLVFGGVGDGRHLFKTISEIRKLELKHTDVTPKRVYCTAIDIKPAAIAHLIIILLLLDDISTTEDAQAKDNVHLCLYYTYLAPLMPPGLYHILCRKISQAIEVVDGNKDLSTFLIVPRDDRMPILRVLKLWQSKVHTKFSTIDVRRGVPRALKDRSPFAERDILRSNAPEQYRKEHQLYHNTAILLASVNGIIHPPEAQAAFESYKVAQAHQVDDKLVRDVESSWKANPVFIDLDSNPQISELGHDPFSMGDDLGVTREAHDTRADDGLYGCVRAFFQESATALETIRERLSVEARVGDVNHFLERSRVLDKRRHKSQHNEPDMASEDLRAFHDRIHLSNIPDYVGGSLSTFLYATPSLHADSSSYATSNCQRNCGSFESVSDYNSEYIALSSEESVAQRFAAKWSFAPRTLKNQWRLMRYIKWQRIAAPSVSTHLAAQDSLVVWLHKMFFKLAIPKERRAYNDPSYIFPSLNLTAFIRLCSQLVVNGYPPHWLNETIESICSGSLTTQARPPRSIPLQQTELNATDIPALKQSTAPFVLELTTLLAMWQHSLPFGLMCPSVPALNTIHEYRIKIFATGHLHFCDATQYILVLMNRNHMPKCDFSARSRASSESLRPYLLSDETRKATGKAQLIRKHLHVMATWKWDFPTMTATFWMGKDVFHDLKAEGDWIVTIWRSDDWKVESKPADLNLATDLGPFWKE